MINPLVSANLRRNSLHASVKVLATSIEVAIILTMVGIQHGMHLHPGLTRLNFVIFVLGLLLFAFAVSWFFVTLARYSEVLEMAQEIGILKVLGASTGYIHGLMFQDTLLITITGTLAGIVMTYAAKWLVAILFPDFLTVEIVYKWWLIAVGIAAAGPLCAGSFALGRAGRLGVIQALSPEE